MKRTLTLVLTLTVAGVAAGCSRNTETAPTATVTKTVTKTTTTAPVEPDDLPTIEPRQPLKTTVGKTVHNPPEPFAYRVTGAQCGIRRTVSQMSKRFDPVYPSRPNATFCIAKFMVFNKSNQPQVFHPLDAGAVTLVDAKGVSYEPNKDRRLPLGDFNELHLDADDERALWESRRPIPAENGYRTAQLWYEVGKDRFFGAELQFRTLGIEDGGVDVKLNKAAPVGRP